MLGDLFCSHISNKFIYILILDLLLFPSHDVLHVLIHHIHPLFLSHEPFHRVLVVHSLHFVICTAHDLCHPRHHILHGFAHAHLLESAWREMYSKVTFWSCASRLLYFCTIWLFLRICWAITFWDCLIRLFLQLAIFSLFFSSNPSAEFLLDTLALSSPCCTRVAFRLSP